MSTGSIPGPSLARPGRRAYHAWTALTHPTGLDEFLPVVVARGLRRGPCLWLTTGLHGPEHTGLLVVHRLLDELDLKALRGSLVVVPTLSPAGLRTGQRAPYHVGADPNRLWPDGKPAAARPAEAAPPSSLETAFARLFAAIRRTADFLIDLHNAWEGSIPFTLVDRVLYRREQPGARAAARELFQRAARMAEQIGFPCVREFPADRYLAEELHRSTSGAALQLARIPALTVELGGGTRPDPAVIEAAVYGLRRVLEWARMLPAPTPPAHALAPIPVPPFPIRRLTAPRAPAAGVVHPLVRAGDIVRRGQPVAELRDVWGRPLLERPLRAEGQGLVLGLANGVVAYPGSSVMTLAVRDRHATVAPYPRDYFKVKASGSRSRRSRS